MYRGHSNGCNIPEMIVDVIGHKLDAPIIGKCEDTEHGRICTVTYSVFNLDINGIPHPFVVTRDETDFIVFHRGHQSRAESLGQAVEKCVSFWESACVA